jgi:hypothetical protein
LQGIGAQGLQGGLYNLQSGFSKRFFLVSAAAPSYAGLTATNSAVTGTLSAYDFTVDSHADFSQLRNFTPSLSSELVYETGSTSAFQTLNAIAYLSAITLDQNKFLAGLTQQTAATTVRIWANTKLDTGTGASTVCLLGNAKTSMDALTTPGNYTAEFERTSFIPELNMKILSVAVTTTTRKIKTAWSPEAGQDMMKFYDTDPDLELTKIMSEFSGLEIDNEILSDLVMGAKVRAAWSRKIGRYMKVASDGTVSTVSFSDASNSTYQAAFTNQQQWYQTLVETMVGVKNEIFKRTNSESKDWFAVCSPDVGSIFESMGVDTFKRNVLADDPNYIIGTEKAGVLNNTFTVYKRSRFPYDTILIGLHGESWLDTGYIYGPYIPFLISPTIIHPDTFEPRKYLMTRYANQMVRPEFYGVIRLYDMDIMGGIAVI